MFISTFIQPLMHDILVTVHLHGVAVHRFSSTTMAESTEERRECLVCLSRLNCGGAAMTMAAPQRLIKASFATSDL